MTTTDTTGRDTTSGSCSCGCGPSMAASAPDKTDPPVRSSCTCRSGDSSGCGPDCGCGSAS